MRWAESVASANLGREEAAVDRILHEGAWASVIRAGYRGGSPSDVVLARDARNRAITLHDQDVPQRILGPRAQGGIRRLPEGGSLREILMSAGAGFMHAMSTREARQRLEVVFLAAHQRGEWAELYLSGLSDPTEAGLAEAIATALPETARGRINPRWVAKQLIGSLLSFVLHEEVLRGEGAAAGAREDYLRQVVDVIAAGVEHLARAQGSRSAPPGE